ERRRGNMVAELLPRLDPTRREDRLITEMIENALKLLRDGTSVGDVKILNASLRELRYAFKVFAPYRGVRKVSVFGSARSAPTAPASRAAHEFAPRMAAEGYMLTSREGPGLRPRLISEEDMALFKVTSSIDEAVEEITGFHRVYHSSRTVGRRLVIRLNRAIPDTLVSRLSADFADILVSGRIEQATAL